MERASGRAAMHLTRLGGLVVRETVPQQVVRSLGQPVCPFLMKCPLAWHWSPTCSRGGANGWPYALTPQVQLHVSQGDMQRDTFFITLCNMAIECSEKIRGEKIIKWACLYHSASPYSTLGPHSEHVHMVYSLHRGTHTLKFDFLLLSQTLRIHIVFTFGPKFGTQLKYSGCS